MKDQFNPEMLILARESRGHTQGDLARLLAVKQGTVSKLEGGMMPISLDLLDKISRVLRYPRSFFFQTEKVFGFGSSVFYHRKRQGLPLKHLRQLHAELNIRRFAVKKLLVAAEIEHFGFRHYDPAEYDGKIELIARAIRSAWRLPPGPIRNLTEAIENAGGVIIRCDFGTRKADAISEWVEPSPPLFFVNSSPEITGDRIRFSLGHELGHVVMHQFPVPDMEDQADRFAAELLLPAREIAPQLTRLNLPKLAALKREWKVSIGALIEQAARLEMISQSQRSRFISHLRSTTHSYREPEETDIPIETPSLLDELVQTHLKGLGYSVSEISAMIDEFEPEFTKKYLPAPKVLQFALKLSS
ncbi:MAG TPA: XRE family transcriptional regulator [Verrucomicrobiae bacterium]|jgi:Zn-dependent peptidase ImmA (M78 family)/DNA-binding XRE family transcriptional regulator|nr:XRE family transcriptional regulator [Verrucomicrobiae bacterium]